MWSIKSRKIECSSVLHDIRYPVMQILAWDLSLSIGRKFDIFHCVAQCGNQFVILAQKHTWWDIRYKEFIQQTSKNRVSKSFVILGNYKKSITLSLRQPHWLFWCACKSHHKLMKQPLLFSVLDWNEHSRTSSITKVVGEVDRVVGEPLMGCSAVILRRTSTTCNRNSLVDFGLAHFFEWHAYAVLIFSNLSATSARAECSEAITGTWTVMRTSSEHVPWFGCSWAVLYSSMIQAPLGMIRMQFSE